MRQGAIEQREPHTGLRKRRPRVEGLAIGRDGELALAAGLRDYAQVEERHRAQVFVAGASLESLQQLVATIDVAGLQLAGSLDQPRKAYFARTIGAVTAQRLFGHNRLRGAGASEEPREKQQQAVSHGL